MLPIDIQIIKYIFFEKPVYDYKIKSYFQQNNYQELNKKLFNYKPDPSLQHSSLENTPFTIFDLETTGLIPELGHEIISIGAIQLNGLQSCRSQKFHRLIKPIRPISKRVTELTGIDKGDINNASSFIDVFDQFMNFSKGSILVAHPAKFDIRFLQTMLKRWKLPDYNPYFLDSQLMAKWLLPQVNYQLDSLIRHFNIDRLTRHHALNDAIMTAELFEQLLRKAIGHDAQTYEELTNKIAYLNKNYSIIKSIKKDWS